MSDQTPPTGAATEAEPTKRAGQGAPTRAAHREAHSGPRLWARARGAFFALPRGLHVVMLIIFMILGFALTGTLGRLSLCCFARRGCLIAHVRP